MKKALHFFDTTKHAKAAERNLIKAGSDEGDISIIESSHIRELGAENGEGSIWQRLFGRDIEEDYAGD